LDCKKVLFFARFKQYGMKVFPVGASPTKIALRAFTCPEVAGFISFLSKIHFISIYAAVS
jgi:hypothetical protein